MPQAVLCGSTNFTENGVYRQANVTHVVESADVAGRYLELFELLFAGNDPAATKAWINEKNPLSADAPLVVGFSPRSGEADLELFASEIRGAKRDVLFCTAFRLNQRIDEALLGNAHDDILRLGIQNSRIEDHRLPPRPHSGLQRRRLPRATASRATSRSRPPASEGTSSSTPSWSSSTSPPTPLR